MISSTSPMMTPSGRKNRLFLEPRKLCAALIEGLTLHEPEKEKETKESNDEPGAEEACKFGHFKVMLSKALIQANTAVLLDNAQRFEGAM